MTACRGEGNGLEVGEWSGTNWRKKKKTYEEEQERGHDQTDDYSLWNERCNLTHLSALEFTQKKTKNVVEQSSIVFG